MSLAEFFGFATSDTSTDELPDIFPIDIKKSDFISTDVQSIYAKILTDVIERTHGLDDEKQQAALWDNCVKSDASEGLITILAKAMTNKADLYLVFEKTVGVLRVATSEERSKIASDYKKSASSSTGVYISFTQYKITDMVKLYSALEYCTIGGLNKSSNLSNSIQIKVSDLRASVGGADAAIAIAQGKAVAKALSRSQNVMIDAKDDIVTATPDLTAINSAMEFIDKKRAWYLGLPAAYIQGEQTGGMNASGEADTKAIERGLKSYFMSIIKPSLKALFDVDVEYKSQDFRQITQGLEALKTFSLVGTDRISEENQLVVINKLFDLDDDAKGDEPEEIDPNALVPPGGPTATIVPGQKPPANQPPPFKGK